MALNLEKALQNYGAYHHNPVNIAIHITCIPAIMFTAIMFGTNTPAVPLPSWLSIPNLPPNFGTAIAVVYGTLYVLMEPVAGGFLAPILLGGAAYANYLTTSYGMTANYIAIGVHLLAWVAQFIGHGVFEGRAPALMDNLVQALFQAPFFVWLEVLFMFGYRPELKSRLDTAIQKDIAKFRDDAAAKKASKANGSTNGQAK